MIYRFIYRDILKVDICADTLRDAIEQLSHRSPVFGIHPLDYDAFFLFDPDRDYQSVFDPDFDCDDN